MSSAVPTPSSLQNMWLFCTLDDNFMCVTGTIEFLVANLCKYRHRMPWWCVWVHALHDNGNRTVFTFTKSSRAHKMFENSVDNRKLNKIHCFHWKFNPKQINQNLENDITTPIASAANMLIFNIIAHANVAFGIHVFNVKMTTKPKIITNENVFESKWKCITSKFDYSFYSIFGLM